MCIEIVLWQIEAQFDTAVSLLKLSKRRDLVFFKRKRLKLKKKDKSQKSVKEENIEHGFKKHWSDASVMILLTSRVSCKVMLEISPRLFHIYKSMFETYRD